MAGKEMKRVFVRVSVWLNKWHVVNLSGWLFRLEAPAVARARQGI